jgi:hypothetical protein
VTAVQRQRSDFGDVASVVHVNLHEVTTYLLMTCIIRDMPLEGTSGGAGTIARFGSVLLSWDEESEKNS